MAVTAPATVNEALSVMVAAVPPFATPVTARLAPSFNVKPAAVKLPRVAT